MTLPETDENGMVKPESLPDATLEALRNQAIGHGRDDVADSIDRTLEERAKASRRRR